MWLGRNVSGMKEVVRENFEQSPTAYDRYERRTGRFAALAGLLRDEMGAAHDGDFDRVLDAGAGTGASTKRFAASGRETVALDISHEMLLANDAGARIQGDFDALPFTDDTFDAVAFTASLFLVPEPSRAVEEAARVLRDGGVVGAVAPLGWFGPDGTDVFDDLTRESRSPTSTAAVEEALTAALDVTTGTVAFETTAEALRLFHSIPAMAARLYPRADPDTRVEKARALLAAVDGDVEQRWRWFVGHP